MRHKLFIAAALLGLLGVLAGASAAWLVFGPNTQPAAAERGIKLPPGASFDSVVDSLRAGNVLKWDASFRLFARLTGWGDQVKAGHYRFEAGASNYEILSILRRGLQEPVRLTVPPGSRPRVVAAVAGRDMHFQSTAFEEALSNPELAASLGTDTSALFGYMMPETYFFYWLTSAENAIRSIKEQFDAFYDRELATGAERLGLSKQDVVTLASIIEWETSHNAEKAMVSGVYHNRLRIGMKLDADPTVQYIVMQREGRKRRLLYEDYAIRHPFNTYLRGGLPPGPLNNPSPSSLRAAVSPADHDYVYFVAKGDGTHQFSRTLAEHNRAAREYHELMRLRRLEQSNGED
ncbi:MAG: endolytic transglycosylase MltG [Rhodothermales bacterium]